LKSFSHAHAKIIEILLLKSNFFGGGALHHGPKGPCFSALEDKMHNLVNLHQVSSTRTSLYKKEEKFAGYILTSPEVKTHHFAVLDHEVSDHTPLFLEFGH
jgi:hypothetical protein